MKGVSILLMALVSLFAFAKKNEKAEILTADQVYSRLESQILTCGRGTHGGDLPSLTCGTGTHGGSV